MAKLTVFKVIRLVLPVVRRSMPQIVAALSKNSDQGSGLTNDELEAIAADIGLGVGEALLRELRLKQDIIDAD